MKANPPDALYLPVVAKPDQAITLLATPEELGLSARACNALKVADVELIGQLVQWEEYQLWRLPNLGRHTVWEIKDALRHHGLELGLDVPGWDLESALAERHRRRAQVRRHLAGFRVQREPSKTTFLEDELDQIVKSVASGRNAEIVRRRWGFGGAAPETLEAVGQDYRLTRERVRQLDSKARKQLAQTWHDAPRLEDALQLISSLVPETTHNASEMLKSEGVTRDEFSIESILEAASLLDRDTSLGVQQIGEIDIVDDSSGKPEARKVVLEFRRTTQGNGCVNVERLALQSGGRLEDALRVRRLLATFSETVWLDPNQTWALSIQPARNRLKNLINKVLSVTPQIHVSELRSAGSRFHRMAYVPPRSVLLQFCRATAVAEVVNDDVYRPKGFVPVKLGWVEETFVEAFQALGSPLAREQLEDFCIDRCGMNIHTFYVYLSYSTLVLRLAPGVYALVGAKCPIGAVEEVKAKHKQTPPSEYGWTEDGQLWCAVPLDRFTLKMGARSLPSFVTQLTRGEWTATFRDGVRGGSLNVTDQGVTQLRAPLTMAGAEPGDTLRITFNLQTRAACIEVGGNELEAVGPSPENDDSEDDDDLDA